MKKHFEKKKPLQDQKDRKSKPGGYKVDPDCCFNWKVARYITLLICKNYCCCCGVQANPNKNIVISVDHIKPKSKYPELATDIRNMQVLCEDCNQGKCNWDMTDWRTEEQNLKAIHYHHFRHRINFS